MSNEKEQKSNAPADEAELSDDQLDSVAGGVKEQDKKVIIPAGIPKEKDETRLGSGLKARVGEI